MTEMQPDNPQPGQVIGQPEQPQQVAPQAPLGQPQYGAPIAPMTPPKKQRHISATLVSLIICIVFLLAAIGFGVWAYLQRQDYKANSDKKVDAAVVIAKKQTAEEKDKEFVEKEKNPYKEYVGPATYGSVKIVYPKTWGAYVNEKGSQPLVNGYWHPSFVPGSETGTAFALRMEVVATGYDQVMKTFDGKVKGGDVKVSPYKAPKVPSVLGSRVDGEINKGQKDSMVVFPLRDKTLKIWTESETFLNDFNNIILANLTFSP